MDFPKASELFRTYRDTIVAKSTRVTMNAVDRDGSDVNLVGAGGAAMGEEIVASVADVEEGFWLDSTRGVKLDRLVWDRFQITRNPAASSFVYVHFSCTAANPLAFAIPAGTKVSTGDGVVFITVVTESFPVGSTGPIAVLARSSLAGPDQNVDENTITSITSQVANAAAGFVATNPAAATGGASRETDSQLRARARRFWTAARRGTKSAIELGALSVPGVITANAFEGLTGPAYPNRMVTLVVSDAFTDALVKQGVTVPTYALKSQAFGVQVGNGLDEYRACGIPVFVRVGQVALISVILRLRFSATAASDIDTLTLLARTSVVNLVNRGGGGDVFDPAAVTALLKSIPGLDVRGDEVVSPAGSVIPSSPYQLLRTSLALVTTDTQATLAAVAPTFVTPGASSSVPV